MKFNFDLLPSPEACIDCRFHTIDKKDRYEGWISRCLINRDIQIDVKEALQGRAKNCPGIMEG